LRVWVWVVALQPMDPWTNDGTLEPLTGSFIVNNCIVPK
jgi:hypothetical protein